MATAQEVINWAKSLANAGRGVDKDGVYGTQCVDLPAYIVKHWFGKDLWGNAIDLLNSARGLGYQVIYDAPNVNPKAGDIFVMRTTNHPFGHTGLVIADSDGYTIKTIEQNVDGNADALVNGGPARYITRNFSGVVGWFRLPYSQAASSSTLPNTTAKSNTTGSYKAKATKKVGGDLYSGEVTHTDPNMMYSSPDRNKIDRIVIHHNATTSDEVARSTWYTRNGKQASAHYQVTPDKIWGCVGENFTAWHAGTWSMNLRSIGIEHLNSTGAPSWNIDERTYANSAKLIADICTRYNIPIDRQHIIKHSEVVPTACPGGINIDKLINMAKAIVQNTGTTAGDDTICFSFNIKNDKAWHPGTIYFYNGNINQINGFHNAEEFKWVKNIYKETTGKDLKHYDWDGKAPVYARIFGTWRPSTNI